MGANIAGIYGAQIFRQDDRPKYRRGFSVAISVLAVGVVLAIGRYVDDWWRRKGKTTSINSLEKDNGAKAVPTSADQPKLVLLDSKSRPVVAADIAR